jgi:DNA adenine methylase
MPLTHSPLRYPGGKSQLAPLVQKVLLANQLDKGIYAEPFAGGAGLALELLFSGMIFEIWLNDLDIAIHAFWKSVLEKPAALCKIIQKTQITLDEWHRQREVHARGLEVDNLALAFATLFLNRTNRSGILKGGVIGGKNQTGPYKLDCRFNKDNLCRKIMLISRYRSVIKFSKLDAIECLQTWDQALPKNSLINIDPPYFAQGQNLYLNHYNVSDHTALSEIIKSLHHPWMLTYDDIPQIEALYKNFPQYRMKLWYTAQIKRKASELLFLSPILKEPIELQPMATYTCNADH